MALTINLNAVITNYHFCAAQTPAQCGAVVKANAYGLGVEQVYVALRQHTACQWFFVAYPAEALELRALEQQYNLSPAKIVVMNGLCGVKPHLLAAANIYPAINHPTDLAIWQQYAQAQNMVLPAVLQVNTGMHRIGMTGADALQAASAAGIDWQLLMTHYACADEQHPLNAQQLHAFQNIQADFPRVSTSLPNSAGLQLAEAYHGDIARPGIALYGGQPSEAYTLPLQPVVQLTAPIIQIYQLQAGDSVGYAAGFVATKPMRITTLQIGYADGLLRAHSGHDYFYLDEYPVPVIGRISMDVCAVDVSTVPEHLLYIGALVEIIGPRRSLEQHAAACGTINYEVLTSLKPRLPRHYLAA